MENIVLPFSSIFLRKFRIKNSKKNTRNLLREFAKIEALLTKLYTQASFWHGTGRYHYFYKGKNKYSRVDKSKTLDVLASIIKSGGIMPKYDPWIMIDGKNTESVSLTKYRMYARCYAEFHRFEKTSLSMSTETINSGFGH